MEVSERPPGRAGILVPIRMTTLDRRAETVRSLVGKTGKF